MDGLAVPGPPAVAVSGGADSVALMSLLARYAERRQAVPPLVLTVDHGLQPGSRTVAEAVAAEADALGLRARILTWRGAKPAGDLEAAARTARYRLMGTACGKAGCRTLFVAHTLEDQAETVLLRLARGSGVDGLSAMQPRAPFPLPGFPTLALARPLLGIERQALRASLTTQGIAWHEDPMNADPRFARVRLRQAWPAFEAAGLSAARIAAAAAHLARAREALEQAATAVLARVSRWEDGLVLFESAGLLAEPREVGLRALARLLAEVGGKAYRPRFERLDALYHSLEAGELGGGRTLGRCRIAPAPKRRQVFGRNTVMITRETGRRPDA